MPDQRKAKSAPSPAGSQSAGGLGRYRRKWKPAPPGRRLAAGLSMADAFSHRRGAGPRWALPVMLAASLALHTGLVLYSSSLAGAADAAKLDADERTYLGKVMQKERARTVSKGLAGKITMPPPPPDPQVAVQETMTREIGTDITRTFGKVLDVKVTGQLAARVEADLRAELAEAAKKIVETKLSEAEIRELQEKFKSMAQAKTMEVLKEHRKETQVQHVEMSLTDWYESRVSGTLIARLKHELFVREYAQIWNTFHADGWGFLPACHNGAVFVGYPGKASRLAPLGDGKFYPPGTWKAELLPDWPEPSTASAKALNQSLQEIHKDWDAALAQHLQQFHLGRLEQAKAEADQVGLLWEQAIKQAQRYDESAGKPEAKPALAEALSAAKKLHDQAWKLWRGWDVTRQTYTANQAVRSRVLRGPATAQAYQRFVDGVVKAFEPPMRDMLETQFREGILVREKGVDSTVKQFTDQALALLRRDVQRALPRGQFEELIFKSNSNPYHSKVTNQPGPPDEADIKADEDALAKVLAAWPADERAYPDKRAALVAQEMYTAVDRVVAGIKDRFTEDGRMKADFYKSVESVDYTDMAQLRLEARHRALQGRGQDLAKLTEDGLPDSSAPMVALMFGAAHGQQGSLDPMLAGAQPGFLSLAGKPASVIRTLAPQYPPAPKWGRMTQFQPKPAFASPRVEAIPFLANFPKLDGDLTDWGRIRPLVLRGTDEPITLYAAWNYQGFFFGYRVNQPQYRYFLVRHITGVMIGNTCNGDWPMRGDTLRLHFDTLDARGADRGEPHTQEFIIFPQGDDADPNIPGAEHIVASIRDSQGNIHSYKNYPQQPPDGPDGTGPYRITKADKDGYTCEVFLPRSAFKMPVLAPGWWTGFEAVVSFGVQDGYWGGIAFVGQTWAGPWHNNLKPDKWGDLLLLGTDPQLTIQEADETGALAQSIVPGHSYLVTVVDPDRNINLSAEDTVLVSAEVGRQVEERSKVEGRRSEEDGPSGLRPSTSELRPFSHDVEVFVLKETGKNTSVFRGYINTQPGRGGQVQGVVECMPGHEVRLGYVDFADSKGTRNPIYQLRLPVVAPVTTVAGK